MPKAFLLTLQRVATRRWRVGLFVLFLIPFVAVFHTAAWVSDDAYITFRTVDNIVQGHGARWNVGERVQAYTHPLWMMLHVPVYAVLGEIAWSTVLLSFGCMLFAFWLLVGRVARGPWAFVCAVAVCFGSRALTDYLCSGLENPLTCVWVAVFATWFLATDPKGGGGEGKADPPLWALSVVIGLAMLNRMDSVLLFAPAMLYRVWESPLKWRTKIWQAGVGAGVIGLWMVVSLIYYGVPLPNTAYAKLGTGLSQWDLVAQSRHYFRNSLEMDPVTLPVIVGTFLLAWCLGDRRARWWALGLPLYLLYVVKIGGDFMAGRFFAVPLFMAACLVARAPIRLDWRTVGVPLVVLGFSLFGRHPLIVQGPSYFLERHGVIGEHGVADERQFYYSNTSLRFGILQEGWPWAGPDGEIFKKRKDQEEKRAKEGHEERLVFVHGNMGFLGFYAGEPIHIIDSYALTDPLLSHLPATFYSGWRIGHFHRRIPEGYVKSVEQGKNLVESPKTRELWSHIRRVTQGPIWSGERWWSIWWLNTGALEHLVDEDLARFGDARRADMERMRRVKGNEAAAFESPSASGSSSPSLMPLPSLSATSACSIKSHSHLFESPSSSESRLGLHCSSSLKLMSTSRPMSPLIAMSTPPPASNPPFAMSLPAMSAPSTRRMSRSEGLATHRSSASLYT